MIRLIFAMVAFAAGAGAFEAMSMETSCQLDGWTNNEFGSDIPVRSAPSLSAPVVGRLPTTAEGTEDAVGDRVYSVRFDIIASLNGWLRIDNISDNYNAEGVSRLKQMGARSGWVPSNAVRFRIQSARGFDAPRATANRIVDFKDDWASDLGDIENILACDGRWALVDLHVRYRRDGGHLIELGDDNRPTYHAWFRGVCGNEETTCDMAPVDVDP